jgi:hypothetical protein
MLEVFAHRFHNRCWNIVQRRSRRLQDKFDSRSKDTSKCYHKILVSSEQRQITTHQSHWLSPPWDFTAIKFGVGTHNPCASGPSYGGKEHVTWAEMYINCEPWTHVKVNTLIGTIFCIEQSDMLGKGHAYNNGNGRDGGNSHDGSSDRGWKWG